MNVPEGFKQTEVGVIPKDWEVKTLGELCLHSKKRINPITTQQVYKCVELEHIAQESGRLLGYAFTDELKSQKTLFDSGDILFGKLRPYLKKFLFADFDGCCTTEIWVLQSKNYIYNKLLFYIVQADAVLEAANQSEGTKMPRADWKKVKEVKIPLPPTRAEQTAIAAALSEMDALIEGVEKLLEKKRRIKQGAMQELLRPKEGWRKKKLGELFEINAGGDVEKEFFSNRTDEKYPYPIYSNSLSNYGLYGYSSHFTSDGNCITVTARGTIGYACFRDHRFAAIGRLLILRPKLDVDCFYISEFINNKIKFAFEVTGVPQLTAPQISKYDVWISDKKSEQTAIAAVLSDMDSEIEQLETQLVKYRQLKTGMMQELLTGKKRLL